MQVEWGMQSISSNSKYVLFYSMYQYTPVALSHLVPEKIVHTVTYKCGEIPSAGIWHVVQFNKKQDSTRVKYVMLLHIQWRALVFIN